MNVERKNLDKILKAVTALRNPTVAPLVDDQWVALETVIDEGTVRKIIPALKEAGAEGIIERSEERRVGKECRL